MAYTDIDDPSTNFKAEPFPGDSVGADFTLGGNGVMKPDIVWTKPRISTNTYGVGIHALFDSSRPPDTDANRGYVGVKPNDQDFTVPEVGFDLTAFITNGFSVGNNQHGTVCNGEVAGGGSTYGCWAWKAGGASFTSFNESGNNPGGRYQANTEAYCSIVDYTGTGAAGTIAHGLGVVPEMIAVKNLTDDDTDWAIQFGLALGNTNALNFNDTSAYTGSNGQGFWNDTSATTSVFTVGSRAETNVDAKKYIAYLWASKQGYCKIGKYEGNGNANGTFIYTGFRPAMIIMKSADSTSSWDLVDDERIGHNVDNNPFSINANTVEGTTDIVDILSNGFKLRIASDPNVAETYVYAAWAKHPFVTSGGTPVTAR